MYRDLPYILDRGIRYSPSRRTGFTFVVGSVYSVPSSRPWECGNPEGVSRESGKGRKPALWLFMLSSLVISMVCVSRIVVEDFRFRNTFSQSGVYRVMTSLVSSLAAMVCAATFFVWNPETGSKSPAPAVGVNVLLPGACPADASFERRDLVVRDLPGSKFWLNEVPLDEDALRLRLRNALSTRAEQLIWIAADEHVSYGEIISVISVLSHDNPAAHLVLATKAQVGPADPADRGFQNAQMNPKLGIYHLCVSVRS